LNVANGLGALQGNTTGSSNTAVGYQAGNTLTTGSNNTLIGNGAAPSAITVSNEITLGNGSVTSFRIPGLSITAGASALTIGSQFAVTNTASAVNYVNATGNSTNNAPIISALGSDADISLVVSGKGTGVVAVGGTTVANSPAQFVPVTSSVNYLQFTGGSNPVMGIGGTDANVPLTLRAKGTYNVTFQTSTGAYIADFAPSTTGFGVNGVRSSGAGTGNAPEVSAQGSDSNINLKLTPKGTGTLQFGTYTAGILAQAGYITITDAGGTSRRLLVG
jgi:hypothetical protein